MSTAKSHIFNPSGDRSPEREQRAFPLRAPLTDGEHPNFRKWYHSFSLKDQGKKKYLTGTEGRSASRGNLKLGHTPSQWPKIRGFNWETGGRRRANRLSYSHLPSHLFFHETCKDFRPITQIKTQLKSALKLKKCWGQNEMDKASFLQKPRVKRNHKKIKKVQNPCGTTH